MGNPFGQTFGFKDPVLGAELDRIYALLSRRLTSANMDVLEVATAIAAAIPDGQLETLNRLFAGLYSATRLVLLDDGGRGDSYVLYASKAAVAGATAPAVFFAGNDATLPVCRIEQAGTGQVLYLSGGGVGRIIDTNVTGCFLTAGGVWTDSSARSRKTQIVVPDGAVVAAKVLELPVGGYEYKDARGNPTGEKHHGTYAEEFHRLFGLGSPEGISALDVASVALTVIQYLTKEVTDLKARVSALEEKPDAATPDVPPQGPTGEPAGA